MRFHIVLLTLAASLFLGLPAEAQSSTACPGLCASETTCGQYFITTKRCFAVEIYGQGYCNIWEEPCDLLPFGNSAPEQSRDVASQDSQVTEDHHLEGAHRRCPFEEGTNREVLEVTKAVRIPART